MDPDEIVGADDLHAGRIDPTNTKLAESLARHPLESIETEYPHYVGAIESPEDHERPSDRHPVFYGCFDWHSSVHSHWALVRQLRLFEAHPQRYRIVDSIDARFTPEGVAREVEYFEKSTSFEKPYGWAWFLRLAAELALWDHDRATEWRTTLEPLEGQIRSLVESEFLTSDRPIRVGTHGNSAFALQCVLDYARTTGDASLAADVADTALSFFAEDYDYPLEYEPIGWDFLSPALTEADLLGRVLDRESFASWIERFLPDVPTSSDESIIEPMAVPSDEEIALHLVGLNLSRAWCLAGLAGALEGHRYADAFQRSAVAHAKQGLQDAFTDDYAGSHWLSSFALYLLTRNQGGIAPA